MSLLEAVLDPPLRVKLLEAVLNLLVKVLSLISPEPSQMSTFLEAVIIRCKYFRRRSFLRWIFFASKGINGAFVLLEANFIRL